MSNHEHLPAAGRGSLPPFLNRDAVEPLALERARQAVGCGYALEAA